MKKIICEVCNSENIKKVDEKFVCQECGIEYSLTEVKKLLKDDFEIETNIKEKEVVQKKKPPKIKLWIILGSVMMTLIIVASISIPLGIKTHYKNVYEKLKDEMMNYNDNSNNFINNYLDQLPYDYRDVETITEQFDMIKKFTTKIHEASSYVYFDKVGATSKCLEARISFYNLMVINNTSAQWNLSNYLDDYWDVVFFGVKWTTDSSYYINWHEEDDSFWLATNFPSDDESSKEYYYDYDYENDKYSYYNSESAIYFSYYNKENEDDRFKAYKIYALTTDSEYFYFNLYCYSNGQNYKIKSKITQ